MITKKPDPDEPAREYDFSRSRHGEFAKLLEHGYQVVVDGHEDEPTQVSAEEVRSAQAHLRTRRRHRKVAEGC